MKFVKIGNAIINTHEIAAIFLEEARARLELTNRKTIMVTLEEYDTLTEELWKED
jgi:hypothetical protein